MTNSSGSNQHVRLKVHVVPRASRSEVVGEYDGGLKIKLAATPIDGKANEELIKLLSRVFKVSRSDVTIISGHKGKLKQVRIEGINADDGQRALKRVHTDLQES